MQALQHGSCDQTPEALPRATAISAFPFHPGTSAIKFSAIPSVNLHLCPKSSGSCRYVDSNPTPTMVSKRLAAQYDLSWSASGMGPRNSASLCGLVVLGPVGPVIVLGIAERDVEGAMPHELFDDRERAPAFRPDGVPWARSRADQRRRLTSPTRRPQRRMSRNIVRSRKASMTRKNAITSSSAMGQGSSGGTRM
jgi:hypothetical protein